MSDRLPFFSDVDQVIIILRTWPDGKPATNRANRTLAEEVDLVSKQAGVWEDFVPKLMPFDTAVLRYVARHFRAREGVMTRRITSILGPGRGNGLIGVLLSTWASASLWTFFRSLAPTSEWMNWITVAGFSVTMLGLIILCSNIIQEAHTSGRLLMLADLLDAVIELQENGQARDQLAVELTAPAHTLP